MLFNVVHSRCFPFNRDVSFVSVQLPRSKWEYVYGVRFIHIKCVYLFVYSNVKHVWKRCMCERVGFCCLLGKLFNTAARLHSLASRPYVGAEIENTMNTFIDIFTQYICVHVCCVREIATPNECHEYEWQRGKNNMVLCFVCVCVCVACYTNVDNTTFVCLLSCVICLNCVSASHHHHRRRRRLRLHCITRETRDKRKKWQMEIHFERFAATLREICVRFAHAVRIDTLE